MEELYKKIKENPFNYLYLKRKRRFTMGDTDVEYGEGNRSEFCVVLSPDGLDNQFPIMDLKISVGKTKPARTEYKNEYFSLSDPDIQKHISEETADKIANLVNIFLEFEDWYLSDADAYKCLK